MATGLATRCPACGTVFRVVLDQLRVSDGWVRCGRCSDVFNAAEALVDLETGASRRVSFEPPSPPPAPPARQAYAEPPDEDIHIEDFEFRQPQAYAADAPAEPEPSGHGFESTAAAMQADAPVDAPVIDSTESRFAADAADAFEPAAQDAAASETAAPQPPSFVREAERAQRWRQPRVRLALAVLGVLAAIGLGVQATYEYRDLAAARSPAMRTALTQVCQWAGCTVGAAHSIEGLSVESTGLVRVEKSSIYKLSVALRNRTGIELALPALDLTLTDGQGQLLARRVLKPQELGSAVTTLAAGRDLTLQATLQTRNLEAVSGYTVELFYP